MAKEETKIFSRKNLVNTLREIRNFFIKDAPSDGKPYFRKDGEWVDGSDFNGGPGEGPGYTGGTGISVDGTVINHSNSVAAATKGATTTTAAGANAGAVTVVGGVKYDAQGHITNVYTRSITLSDTTYSFSTLTFSAGTFTAGTFTATGGAKTINIPTKTSHLEIDSSYVAPNVYATDISTISKFNNGVSLYLTNNSTPNLPSELSSNYGLLIVVKFSDTNAFELFFEFSAADSAQEVYKRAYVSGKWNPWKVKS